MKLRQALAVLSAGILALSLTACSSAKGYQEDIARLEEENATLRAQLESMGVQPTVDTAELQNWNLVPEVAGNAVKVTLTAVPAEHSSAQTARLLVCLDEQEAASAECSWNGTAYTATVDLEPNDGYWYYFQLSDGSKTSQTTLCSPENPVVDTAVYLASSLNSFCFVYVSDYTFSNSVLSISQCSAQVQLPRLSNDKNLTLTGSRLSFRLDGSEISGQDVTLPQGEGDGCFEETFEDLSFQVPDMQSDSQLELWLVATLSDGSQISGNGGTWYMSDGQLSMVVG